jgi:hypothetical protein
MERIRIHRVFIPGHREPIPFMVFPRLGKIGIFYPVYYHDNLVIEYFMANGSFRIEHFHGILAACGEAIWLNLRVTE